MRKGLLGNETVMQVGIIVRDIEKASEEMAAFFGMEKPEAMITDGFEKAQTELRGEPSEATAKLAFLHCGQVDLELIEPDENPSTWREFLDEHGEGIHHIAFVINGMKMVVDGLEKAGYPLIQKGEYTGGRYAYMETSKTLKTIVELLEND
jgi:methylmalonyl-CoA/ethylmalonyl-CoA epimerase